MYYKLKIKDTVRVDPKLFGKPIKEALHEELKNKYTGHISQELGIVILVGDIHKYSDGIIIPEDGGSYHEVVFDIVTFIPEMKEVTLGVVKKIEEFGAFISLGTVDGMVHISQTMDDYVSFSKDGVLQGKETKKTLKVNDVCRARIIAISYKDITNFKIGLTMRQPFLGKIEWIYSEDKKVKK